MFNKILMFFVLINAIVAEESNEIDSAFFEATSQNVIHSEVLNGTDVVTDQYESTPLDETQQKIGENINRTLSNIKTAVDQAEKKWKAWIKNYDCTNSSTNMVRCVTGVRSLKGLNLWNANTGKVEIPTELPYVSHDDSDDNNWPHKIKNSLEEWFSYFCNFKSQSKKNIK